MAYTFKKGKHPPFSITISNREVKKSITPEALVLRKLRQFLDANEPGLVYFLLNLWRNEQKAITYKELREAILAGDLSTEYLEQWRQDYTKFVIKHLQPAWIKAMEAAVKELEEKYPEWRFDPMADGVREWTETRAADFVTSVTEQQMMGIRAVVQKAAVMNELSVDELARAIRPMVGLYAAQSRANLRYYENLIKKGVKEKRALDLSIRYGARQHRYRGYLIARTELAYSYNKGYFDGIKQAQAKGYMGEAVKIWCTADDERVCPYCGSLEGKTIALDEEFAFRTKLAASNPGIRLTPPAHPNCRCTIMVQEIAPPNKQRG